MNIRLKPIARRTTADMRKGEEATITRDIRGYGAAYVGARVLKTTKGIVVVDGACKGDGLGCDYEIESPPQPVPFKDVPPGKVCHLAGDKTWVYLTLANDMFIRLTDSRGVPCGTWRPQNRATDFSRVVVTHDVEVTL